MTGHLLHGGRSHGGASWASTEELEILRRSRRRRPRETDASLEEEIVA